MGSSLLSVGGLLGRASGQGISGARLALVASFALYMFSPGVLGSVVGAAGYFVLGVLEPAVALAVLPATLPFYLSARAVGGLEASPPEAALALAASATALRVVLDRLRGAPSVLNARPTVFDAPIAFFLAAALLSLLASQYLRLSVRELRTLVLEPLAFYYLAVWLLRTPKEGRLLAYSLLAGAAAAALLALGQYLLDVGTTSVEGVRRASALYQSPNNLALMLGRALPFALAGALLAVGRTRLAFGAAAAVLAAADVATFSLGGWISALSATLVVLGGRGRRALLWGTVVLVAAALALLPALRVERVASHLDSSSGSTTFLRLELWRSALAMLHDHPLLGIGMDNFLYLYRQDYLPSGAVAEPNLSHPHNLVLHFWLALGLPGLVAACWLLWRFARRTISVVTSADGGAPKWLALGALGSMVDFVVHGLGDNSYFLVDLAFVFWLTFAVVEPWAEVQDRERACATVEGR